MSSSQPEAIKLPPNITLPIISTPNNSITATTVMPPIITPTTITTTAATTVATTITTTIPTIPTPPTIQATAVSIPTIQAPQIIAAVPQPPTQLPQQTPQPPPQQQQQPQQQLQQPQPQLQPQPTVSVAPVIVSTLTPSSTTTVTPTISAISNLKPTPNIITPTASIASAASTIIPHQQPQALPQQPPLPPTATTTLPALNLTQAVQQAPLALLKPIKYICCLFDNGIRCDRVAGNASFSLKIQKIVGTKGMNITLDPTVRHTYICEHHKAVITVAKKAPTIAREPAQVRQVNNSKGVGAYAQHVNQTGGDNIASASGSSSGGGGGVDVDLQQLQVNTLRRYKRHFRIQTKPGLNKMQLAEAMKGHFRTLPIIEKEAITYFVYIVKCYRNKLDHNPKEFD